jgi:hypothetical protein
MPLTPEQIASITGAPLVHVAISWPALEAALVKHGCYSEKVAVATIATVRVECPPFHPIHEYGNSHYFEEHYEGRKDLGNLQPGDGVKYAGRGFIQLTGRTNYEHFGKLLNLDLVADPDLVLQPGPAAELFVLFFKNKGCTTAADALNWKRVRELVNGGHNGLDLFLSLIEKLLAALPAIA